jgi:hypothetical protein
MDFLGRMRWGKAEGDTSTQVNCERVGGHIVGHRALSVERSLRGSRGLLLLTVCFSWEMLPVVYTLTCRL